MSTAINNVTCAACGCICENASVHVEHGVITQVEGACRLCTNLLLGQTAGESEPCQIDDAIEILAKARAPLVYGLSDSSIETQRAAVALAESLGATIDPALPAFHRAALQAMQSVGISTCTLGEVKQRADVVVFWGTDPTTSHSCLFERFLDPRGSFVTGNRHVVSVGVAPPRHRFDEFLQIDNAENLVALTILRSILTDVDLNSEMPFVERIRQLADRLQSADYSAIFFGPNISGLAEIESLFRLVRQLNARSRSVAIGLSRTQCDNVLTWQTGFPCSVNFSLGYPRYDPLLYSANAMLERTEIDAVMFVGSAGISELSTVAKERLAEMPIILLDYPESPSSLDPTVRIVTARPGVHCDGTVFRMDGVPIRLGALFNSPLPTTEFILNTIRQRVGASCI
jgi:formylmethanofuran dehydrogenase subunit B